MEVSSEGTEAKDNTGMSPNLTPEELSSSIGFTCALPVYSSSYHSVITSINNCNDVPPTHCSKGPNISKEITVHYGTVPQNSGRLVGRKQKFNSFSGVLSYAYGGQKVFECYTCCLQYLQ